MRKKIAAFAQYAMTLPAFAFCVMTVPAFASSDLVSATTSDAVVVADVASHTSSDSVPAEKKAETPSKVKLYGFVRNFMAFDSRQNIAGTKDLFYYLPKDENIGDSGDDVNAQPNFRFLAITSRFGIDVSGYSFGKTDVSAKIETDFYCMNGNVAVLRLRQAYARLSWAGLGRSGKQSASFKIGQAWHPLAEGQPYVIALETGTPFNPFSRTPLALVDYNFSKAFTFTGGIIYQMQYLSAGPSGASADYIKYSMVPEVYAGLTLRTESGFSAKAGVDVLSIKPRWRAADGKKLNDRITTAIPYVYADYKSKDFSINAKVVYGSAGEHINLLSGYGVSKVNADGSQRYTPLHSISSFVSAKYGRKVQVQGMLGFIRNLGTSSSLVADKSIDGVDYTSLDNLYISKNGFYNLNSLIRFTPTVVYNLGSKLVFGLEYDITSAYYGKATGMVKSSNGLANDDCHWVTNHRVLAMVKFTF